MPSQTFVDFVESLDGKVLCVAEGKPIEVDSAGFVTITASKKDIADFENFEITGVATHSLISNNDPGRGAEALEKPLVVSVAKPAITPPNSKADNAIFLSQLNRWLGLTGTDELEDGDEIWDRFTEDHPKSVMPVLKSKGLYLKLGKLPDDKLENAEKFGNFPFYVNLYIPPLRTTSKSKFEDIKARRIAAREKANESPL